MVPVGSGRSVIRTEALGGSHALDQAAELPHHLSSFSIIGFTFILTSNPFSSFHHFFVSFNLILSDLIQLAISRHT